MGNVFDNMFTFGLKNRGVAEVRERVPFGKNPLMSLDGALSKVTDLLMIFDMLLYKF